MFPLRVKATGGLRVAARNRSPVRSIDRLVNNRCPRGAMDQLLTRRQADLVALERNLVLRVRDLLARADGARDDLERLARLVTEMDELFLLVVAGEYNAGKSTFINALLGDEVFAMGDLPTTRAISILRHGDPGPPERLG